MYKQTQYLSNESLKPMRPILEKVPVTNTDDTRQRSLTSSNNYMENYSEQRLIEIKKKHGLKERVSTQQYQSKPFRDITMKTSNSNTLKAIEKDQKSKSSSMFKSILLNPTNQQSPYTIPQQPRTAQKIERRSSQRSDIRESIVSRVDEFKDIPKFGGKSSKLQAMNVSKSIQLPVTADYKEQKGSIDKIKAKFNHILNCFNQNNVQKHLEKYRPEYLQYKQKISRVDIEQTRPQILKSKVYVETNQNAFNKYYVPGRVSRHADSVQNRSRRFSANYSPLQNAKARCSYLPSEDSNQGQTGNKIKIVDQQIKRIEERIKRSTQEKRKLDIKTLENKESFDFPRRLSCYSKAPIDKSVMVNRRQKLYGNVPPIRLRTQDIAEPYLERLKQSERLYTEQQSYPEPMSLNHNNRVHKTIQIETGRGQNGKVETKRLVQMLKIQVQLDQKLRNAKATSSYSNVKNKWDCIKQILQKHKIYMTETEVQSQFEITLEEHNPFFSVRQCNLSLEEIVSKYVQSYQHWNSNVVKKFSYDVLKAEGFNEQSIDLQKKGHLNIEDLVRFLNFETKNFYRNRDLVLLFRRISEKSSIMFKDLMDIVSRS